MAILTYYLIEKPLRNARNKYITAILLALSVFGTGLIGAFIFHINGVKDREINKSAGEYASVTDVYNYYKYGELPVEGYATQYNLLLPYPMDV